MALLVRDVPAGIPAPDPAGGLLGRWVWHDEERDPAVREVAAGQVVAELGLGYWLVRYLPHPRLRPGVSEVVHLSRLDEERWSVFDTEDELRGARDAA